MKMFPEYIIERKKDKMQIRKWKITVLILVVLALFLNARNFIGQAKISSGNDHIGLVLIEDIIYEDGNRDKKLEEISEEERVKALIVYVNSPGGTVVGAERIYNILRKIAVKKPVVIVMGTLAASGGYLVSLGGDYIIAHNGTITGSIGVILQTAEITELAEKLGIKFNNFKSGELKASPNLTEKLTDAMRQATMESVMDTYDFFVELVAKRRSIPLDEVKKLADGRVYIAKQALQLKLIDAIGFEDDAVKWLQEVKGLSPELKIKEIKLRSENKMLDLLYEDFGNMIPGFLRNKLQGITATWGTNGY